MKFVTYLGPLTAKTDNNLILAALCGHFLFSFLLKQFLLQPKSYCGLQTMTSIETSLKEHRVHTCRQRIKGICGYK